MSADLLSGWVLGLCAGIAIGLYASDWARDRMVLDLLKQIQKLQDELNKKGKQNE